MYDMRMDDLLIFKLVKINRKKKYNENPAINLT